MSWFQLDASTIACRVRAEGEGAAVPTLLGSIVRGVFGFTVVSVAGFVPWAVFGDWLQPQLGEGGMFGVCAAVFILLSGALLHRLIIGPGSLLIFYKLFSISFAAYSVAWMLGWMTLGGDVGSIVGLLAGAVVMGWMLARAFELPRATWKVIAALFVLTSAGYFGGGWLEAWVFSQEGLGLSPATRGTIGKLLWGVCFGAGFGAALGVAFHLCQTDVREFLRAEAARGAR